MALDVRHIKVDVIPDDPADAIAGKVLPSDWNDAHTFTGTLPAANGGVEWPLPVTPVIADPTPTGDWFFYILSDGNASPNNMQTAILMTPLGTKIILGEEMI